MKKHRYLLIPFYIFTIIFVAIPILYVLALSVMTRGENRSIIPLFTLKNYRQLFDPFYIKVFLSSIKLALLSTVIIAVIGYPFGYFMSRLSERGKKLTMFFLMLPFFTSSLIRLNGWIIVFRANGLFNSILLSLGIIKEPLKILYSYPAVIIGMVYVLLPFMILSVYSSSEKLDNQLMEAAYDLGANKLQAFFTIDFKLTLPGLLSGMILTFVPSMGLFFIADILGGNKIVLIGNLIQDQITRGNNIPFAAAISVTLMLLTLLMISLYSAVVGSFYDVELPE